MTVTDADIVAFFNAVEASYGGSIPDADIPGVLEDIAELTGETLDRIKDAIFADRSFQG